MTFSHARKLLFSLLCGAAGCAHRVGDGPYVASLSLRGVHLVNQRQLEKGLASRPPQPFVELELDRDRTRITRFYETHGFFATKVVHAEGTPRPQSKAVDVQIAVEEGPPTLIGDVSVFGLDSLDDKTRAKVQQYQLGLQRGQVFHHDDYLRFKETLTRELKRHGYADADIEGAVTISPADNLAAIVIRLHSRGTPPPPPPVAEGSVNGEARR